MLLHTVFTLFVLCYLFLGFLLLTNLPHQHPTGGPDEPMHISMVEFISTHHAWPAWDSPEILRAERGVSYSNGSSVIYWLHALTYNLFNCHRIGAYFALIIYLFASVILYFKNKAAGLALTAGLLPQTLFIFSYVNADSGIIISALFFGLSVGFFYSNPKDLKRFFILFFFAGFTITSRQHLWPIAFITLLAVLFFERSVILKFNLWKWVSALTIGLIPAMWWFTTSYTANGGDVFGIFTTSKSILQFGDANLPTLAKGWNNFPLHFFFTLTLRSLYATWGWMNIHLRVFEYHLVAFIALITIASLCKTLNKKIVLLSTTLILFNIVLMIVYSIYYDYQPQGRYLFPSIYIFLGITAGTLLTKKMYSKNLLILLTLFIAMNLFFSMTLATKYYIPYFKSKPTLIKDKLDHPLYTKVDFFIDQLLANKETLTISGWLYDQNSNNIFQEKSLILSGANNSYNIQLETEDRPDVAQFFKNKNLSGAGFSALCIYLNNINPGKYKVYFSIKSEGKKYLIQTNETLVIDVTN